MWSSKCEVHSANLTLNHSSQNLWLAILFRGMPLVIGRPLSQKNHSFLEVYSCVSFFWRNVPMANVMHLIFFLGASFDALGSLVLVRTWHSWQKHSASSRNLKNQRDQAESVSRFYLNSPTAANWPDLLSKLHPTPCNPITNHWILHDLIILYLFILFTEISKTKKYKLKK